MAIVDDQLRVVFANEALLRLGQYSREEIAAERPMRFSQRKIFRIFCGNMNQATATDAVEASSTCLAKTARGSRRSSAARYIQGPDGQEYVLLIVTDISAQKRVEEQLRESNAQLEKRQMEIDAELSLAARVQQSLAPQSLVWKISVEAYYSPARTIGGDFGVVFPQGDESLKLLMCDVSGHGLVRRLWRTAFTLKHSMHSNARAGPGILLRRASRFRA